jgi:hypothetical protein
MKTFATSAKGHKVVPQLIPPMIYTIVQRMPIEADGRLRYRIKSKLENIERVVTEDQLSYSQ